MFEFAELLQEQAEKLGLGEENLDAALEEAALPSLEELSQSMLAYQERMGRYLTLSREALAELSDEELFEAIYTRAAETDELNYAQQVFQVVSDYDMELQNGGLCQYFANSAAQNAAMLGQALEAIGAEAHGQQFRDFLDTNGIDAKDLASFAIGYDADWESSYAKLTERYPFDAYDEAYYQLPPLQPLLTAYVRAHLEQF